MFVITKSTFVMLVCQSYELVEIKNDIFKRSWGTIGQCDVCGTLPQVMYHEKLNKQINGTSHCTIIHYCNLTDILFLLTKLYIIYTVFYIYKLLI